MKHRIYIYTYVRSPSCLFCSLYHPSLYHSFLRLSIYLSISFRPKFYILKRVYDPVPAVFGPSGLEVASCDVDKWVSHYWMRVYMRTVHTPISAGLAGPYTPPQQFSLNFGDDLPRIIKSTTV